MPITSLSVDAMIYLNLKDLQKLHLPATAWTEELFERKHCYVLRNPVYCRVFWMHLWRSRLIESFRKQQNYNKIDNVDLDRLVVIDADSGALLSAPASVNSLEYFERILKKDSYFENNVLLTGIDTTAVTVAYLVVVALLIAWSCYATLSKRPPMRLFNILTLL